MSKQIFYVDLPDHNLKTTSDDNAYIHIAIHPTRKSARKWLLDIHGMPPKIADFFITEGTES